METGTGNPSFAEPIHRGDRVRETPGLPYRTFTPPDFHARAGSAQKTHAFLCRTCCIGVGLPVLLPRRAGFPRRSARCGGILRDKLRETPVSLCATIKVLFLMLVLSVKNKLPEVMQPVFSDYLHGEDFALSRGALSRCDIDNRK